MGKAFMAWLLVAGAVAAPTMGPREFVEAAVSRVVLAIQRVNMESSDPPRPSRDTGKVLHDE